MKISLRKWKSSDIENLVKHANNSNIACWLTDAFPYPYTRNDAESYIEMVTKSTPVNIFAIEVDGEAVGSIGLFPQQDIHRKNAEMGYWLSEEYWGRGIVPLAINQLVEYGFRTFDINRIYARPFGTNIKSQRVLEKAGFKLEAILENVLYKDGKYMNEFIYSIHKQ